MTRLCIRVGEAAIDADSNERWLTQSGHGIGALVSFSGLVRDDDPLDPLSWLELQHYPGMTERSLNAIAIDASRRWVLHSVLVEHRVGILLPGERIVHVGVAAGHRQTAFDACCFLMDWLKTSAPFWKREARASGVSWVQARSSDAEALARWQ